jgi:hypothetical protein
MPVLSERPSQRQQPAQKASIHTLKPESSGEKRKYRTIGHSALRNADMTGTKMSDKDEEEEKQVPRVFFETVDDTAVEVWVDWTKGDTYGTHKFVYSKEMTDTFLESYNAENGKYGKMFTIKLNGIEAFEDLWVYGVVSGEQGVCIKAERMELK